MDRECGDAFRRAYHADRPAALVIPAARRDILTRGGAAHRKSTFLNFKPTQPKTGVTTMRSQDAFPSRYLKSSDVKARPIIATISNDRPQEREFDLRPDRAQGRVRERLCAAAEACGLVADD